jgi:hypothetical protein
MRHWHARWNSKFIQNFGWNICKVYTCFRYYMYIGRKCLALTLNIAVVVHPSVTYVESCMWRMTLVKRRLKYEFSFEVLRPFLQVVASMTLYTCISVYLAHILVEEAPQFDKHFGKYHVSPGEYRNRTLKPATAAFSQLLPSKQSWSLFISVDAVCYNVCRRNIVVKFPKIYNQIRWVFLNSAPSLNNYHHASLCSRYWK